MENISNNITKIMDRVAVFDEFKSLIIDVEEYNQILKDTHGDIQANSETNKKNLNEFVDRVRDVLPKD